MNSFKSARYLNPVNIFQTMFAVVFTIIITTHIAVAEENSDAPGLTQATGLFMSPNASAAQSNKGALNKAVRKMNKAAMSHRSVRIDKDVLKKKRIRLNLFDGSDFTAERTHIKQGIEGDMTWSGKLVGSVRGSAHITVRGDAAAGSIVTEDGQLFEINSAADGGITIEEIDLDKMPPHVNPLAPEGESVEEDLSGGASIENAPTTSADNGSVIDLMVVYTQATKNRYGVAGIETKIINAVDAMNNANANSLINSRFHLVHMEEVNYVETGDMDPALRRLTNTNDGFMDNVHALRDQHGADIVSLIDEDSNYCGIAWVMTSGLLSNNRMAGNAFNVVYSGCLSSDTLAHEVGHNEGCAHDRANSNVAGSYPYSYGHQDAVNTFRTIMAINCSGSSCPRIQNFSNPNVTHNGAPTGIDHNVDPNNSTDNARTINNNESIIANWRQSVGNSVPPKAPGSLNAVALSDDSIDVSWADKADNEEGVSLERSPDGVNSWTVIATLAADTTIHSDNGLSANTSYFYRVKAFNGAGDSGYSNKDSAVTDLDAPVLEVIVAKAKLKPGLNDDVFKVKGIFTLDPGSDGIDPVTESFNLTLGTFSETINPGSFVRKKKSWIYKAPKAKPFSGIMKIALNDSGKLTILAKGVDLSGNNFNNPVLISIQINNDQAQSMIPFSNNSAKYSNPVKATPTGSTANDLVATVAFAKLKPGLNDDYFKLKGYFILGSGSDGIDPVNEPFVLTLGAFSETINPGSFVRKKSGWLYKAPKAKPFSGILTIVLNDNGKLQIVAKGVDLSGIDFSNPAPLDIQIANDQAQFLIPFNNISATFKKK
jgi:peptidyl-Asp metalloendopeptidase